MFFAWVVAVLALQDEAGAIAPPGTWATHGGDPARNAVTATAPLLGPVEVGWEAALPGAIEGEPLVWDELVVVAVRESERARSLHVLDLATGEPVAPARSYRTRLPLAPSLRHRTVLVRADATRLEAVGVAPGRIYAVWQATADAPLGPPLLFESEVFAATEKALVAWRLAEREPRWSEHGAFRGHVSLRGERVWAVRYDAGGQAWLLELDRAKGRVAAQVPAGAYAPSGARAGALPPIDVEPAIAVHDRLLFLQHPAGGAQTAGGRTVWLDDWRGSRVTARSLDLLTETTTWNGAWLGVLRDPSAATSTDPAGVLGLQLPGASQVAVLARADHHPEFVTPPLAPSRARGVAYVGARAVDLESRRILWELPLAATRRAVPARGAVLVVTASAGGDRLVAIRERRPAARRDVFLDVRAGGEPLRAAGARAVFEGGEHVEGELELDPREQRIALLRGGREQESWPLPATLLLEEADGRIRFARGPREAVRALEVLIEADLARRYAELADDAAAAGDAELGARLLQEATVRGAEEREVERARAALDALAARPGRLDAYRAGKLAEAERALASLPAATYWTRASALSGDAPLALRAELLRAVLLAEPGNAGAAAAVRALLPGGTEAALGPRVAADPLDWLDFVLAVRDAPIDVVRPDAPDGAWALGRLRAAQREWRGDLVGLRSEHLLILTPVARPGALARCLSMGELVCAALESLFGPGSGAREGERDQPLELRLYESREEYLRYSQGGDAHGLLTETAGHYDPLANVSRIYLPEGEDAFARVQEVYAHELAHHWLRAQCPLFTAEQAAAVSATAPGFWVVEGFAKLVEEFRFDLPNRTWTTTRPDAASLSAVATLAPAELIPWGTLLGASQQRFAELSPEPHAKLPLPGYLGREALLGQRSCFYLQAGAVSQYLFHAQHGRLRPHLLKYVGAFYAGREDELDVKRAFGLSAEELGRRVTEYARSTSR